jgi:hypothetical protein
MVRRIRGNQESYNKFISPEIITVIKIRRLELVENVAITDGKGTVKKLIEGKTRRREKGRPRLRWMYECCRIGLEEYGCKMMENKSFGQNRMAIYREGIQGQTERP